MEKLASSILLFSLLALSSCDSTTFTIEDGEEIKNTEASITAPVVTSPKDGDSGESFVLSGKAEPNTEIWWLSYNEDCLSSDTFWSGGQEVPVDVDGNFSTNLETSWFGNSEPSEILVVSVKPGVRELSDYDGACFPSEYVTGPIEINYTGELSGRMTQ